MGLSPRRGWAFGLALCALSLGTAASLAAQQPPAKPAVAVPAKPGEAPAPAPPADPQLVAFAKAFVAVGLVRDDYDARLALPKNKTVELQTSIREEMKQKVDQAIQTAGLNVDVYRRIEYSITTDGARRAAFDQVLREANNAL